MSYVLETDWIVVSWHSEITVFLKILLHCRVGEFLPSTQPGNWHTAHDRQGLPRDYSDALNNIERGFFIEKICILTIVVSSLHALRLPTTEACMLIK